MTSFREFQRREAEGRAPTRSDLTLPGPARAFQGQRAGFPTRALSAVIDVAVVVLLVFASWAALWFVLALAERGNPTDLPGLGIAIAFGTFLLWAYWTGAWATGGRSIGAYVMGLRVVNYRGERMRWLGAAARAAFCLGLPIGLLWVLVSRQNRSVQDVVMRTSVIYDWVLRVRT